MWKEAKKMNAEDQQSDADLKLQQYLRRKTTRFAPQLKLQSSWEQPQTSWMFEVSFFFSEEAKAHYGIEDGEPDPSYMCIKADLPKHETTTKDFYFFGTQMSRPVYRNYAGDCELQFWLRGNKNKIGNEGDSTKRRALLDILTHRKIDTLDGNFPHLEFERIFSKIWITLKTIDGGTFKVFVLENPTITSVDTGGSVSYDSEEGLKLSVTVHYDHWSTQYERG